MSSRPPRGRAEAVEFGRTLRAIRELRGKRRASMDAVVADLHQAGHAISKASISNYERGRVPDILHLYALADLYQVHRGRLVDALVLNLREGMDFRALFDHVCHGSVVKEGSPQGSIGGPPDAIEQAHARIRALALERDLYRDVLEEVQSVAADAATKIEEFLIGGKDPSAGNTRPKLNRLTGKGRRPHAPEA